MFSIILQTARPMLNSVLLTYLTTLIVYLIKKNRENFVFVQHNM